MIDFPKWQTRMVIEGLVTEVILPLQDLEKLKKGEAVGISFAGLHFRDFTAEIVNVSVTSVAHLTNVDAYKCGFAYFPFFLQFLEEQGLSESDTIQKVEFLLFEN